MIRNWLSFLLITFFVTASGAGQTEPSQPARKNTHKQIGNANGARALVAQAKSATLRIREDFQRGLLLDQIGAAEAKTGNLDTAVETAQRAYPHTMATLEAIGTELGNSNDLTKARLLGSKLKGGESSSIFYFIAKKQAESGNISEALHTAGLIQAPEVRRGALESIAEQQAVMGNYSGARETIALATAAYAQGKGSAESIELMIATVQLSQGDTEGARQTIAAIKSPDKKFQLMILNAEALFERKDHAGAIASLEEYLGTLPKGSESDIERYLVLPFQARLNKESALQAAAALHPDLRTKGYVAVAVVCAETGDTSCVDIALEKMQVAALSLREGEGTSDFVRILNILNVTAALIDYNQFAAARRWLATVDQPVDDVFYKMSIEPTVQLQRVVMLAREGEFRNARLLAIKMRRNSVSEIDRGTALRIIAVLETRKNGVASTRAWASRLADSEDQAYAFLGIAQSLLNLDAIKLPYAAIQIH